MPMGEMLKQGITPFSGECGNSLLDRSVNNTGISCVNLDNFVEAHNYEFETSALYFVIFVVLGILGSGNFALSSIIGILLFSL